LKLNVDDVKKVYKEWKRTRKARAANASIFVKGVPSDWSDNDLGKLFFSFGKVVSSKLKIDWRTGKSRGMGYVNFETAEVAS